jgi:hypothetical protein
VPRSVNALDKFIARLDLLEAHMLGGHLVIEVGQLTASRGSSRAVAVASPAWPA